MEVLIIKIKNTTDDMQEVDLNKFTMGIEVETEVKETEMLVDGLKIVTNSGDKVHSCFFNKSIEINSIAIYVPEWLGVLQKTIDYANIKLLVDSFDTVKFQLNPRKKFELHIPVDKCNFKLYKPTKTEI